MFKVKIVILGLKATDFARKVDIRWKSVCVYLYRFNARRLIRGKGQIILASVMQGEGNGYKDDFFKMAFGQNSKGKIDSSGRYYASYFLSTKGTGLFSMTLRH